MRAQIAIGGIRKGGENGPVVYGCLIGKGLDKHVDRSGWNVFMITTVTEKEADMILNKSLLPEQLQLLLSRIVEHPMSGIELPSDMPFGGNIRF